MAVSINTKIRLRDFRRTADALIAQLKTATTQQESRVVVTTGGKPAVVVQEYGAYQRLLELVEKMEQEVHLAEAKKRILENEAEAKGISLEQVAAEFGIDADGLAGQTLTARFMLSIAEEGGEPESMIDVSLDSADGDSWRRESFSLRRYGYKKITMCIETEAWGSVENPMERAVWALPRIRSRLQSPARPPSRAMISQEERLLRQRQLEALGYIE